MYIVNNLGKKNDYISILLKQSSRYAIAAQQDESPLIAVLHSNYAAGYLWALKDVATESEINKILYNSNTNLKTITHNIKEIQSTATKKATSVCGAFMGKDINIHLATLSGNI